MRAIARRGPPPGKTVYSQVPSRGAETATGAWGGMRQRRLLLIARDYPPINTPGTLRALGFTRHLPEFGWDTSVVTLRGASSRWKDPDAPPPATPERARVYQAFGFDTKEVFSPFGRYPQVFALPDRNVSWLPAGVVQALRAVREGGVDAVLSTGPPQTAHCIAHVVQRLTGLPWVADVRDLWDRPPARARLSHSIEKGLARRILRACDELTVVTREIADGLMNAYAVDVQQKLHILPNGFDAAAFDQIETLDGGSERFTIAHVGDASREYRNPRHLFEALRTCIDRGTLPSDTLISFPGADGSVRSIGRTFGLQALVRVRERISYLESLREMRRASVLLLLQGEEFRHAVPTKTYDYLRSGRPIVALVPTDGEAARLLRPFSGVFIASPGHQAAIRECLEAAYRSWRGAHTFERREAQLVPYSRRSVAATLAQILHRACEPKTSDRGGMP